MFALWMDTLQAISNQDMSDVQPVFEKIYTLCIPARSLPSAQAVAEQTLLSSSAAKGLGAQAINSGTGSPHSSVFRGRRLILKDRLAGFEDLHTPNQFFVHVRMNARDGTLTLA